MASLVNTLIPRNESNLDRGLRIALGVGLLAMVFVGPKTLWGLVGLVPLVTGIVGSCPIYRMLGMSTCAVER